jgi:long-chain acyl-CoA synthetase
MYKNEGRYQEISWNDFGEKVRYLALGLSSLGVKQGDRVALLSEGRPEWAMSDLAILSEGAVTVPIYQTNTSQQIAYVLNDSEAVVVIVSTEEQLQKVKSVMKQIPSLERIVVMDPLEDPDVLTFESVLETGKELLIEEPDLYKRHAERADVSDLATIIYTSGTTGEPKGVMLTHENILFNCDAANCVCPIDEKDRCLSFLPLSHVFERTVGQFHMLFNGVAIAYAEGIDKVADNMGEVQPTLMVSVPRLFEKMYARVLEKVYQSPKVRQKIFFWGIQTGKKLSPHRLRNEQGPLALRIQYAIADRLVFQKVKARLGGRLRYFVSGGAPLNKEIAEFFYAAGVTILEGYGLTETSPVISANRTDKIKFGTIGPPLEGVEVRIAEDGEILTRSPSVMKGYFKKEEATREVIDSEGWFYTGDIGMIDEDGYITITDRKKDIIVTSGGKNVAPQYIENLLISDKFISQVMVYGDKRKYLTALVVPDFEALGKDMKVRGMGAATPQEMAQSPEVLEFIMSRIQEKLKGLARFEQIKKIALLDHEFSQENDELTPTLKVRRKIIIRKYMNLLDGLYEKEF